MFTFFEECKHVCMYVCVCVRVCVCVYVCIQSGKICYKRMMIVLFIVLF